MGTSRWEIDKFLVEKGKLKALEKISKTLIDIDKSIKKLTKKMEVKTNGKKNL